MRGITILWLATLFMTTLLSPIESFSHVGVDFGTSGCRISIIDRDANILQEESTTYSDYQDPQVWMQALDGLMTKSASKLSDVKSICISGTSASCLMVDEATLQPTRTPRMYNMDVKTLEIGSKTMEYIQTYAPPQHTTRSSTSCLAKLLAWHFEESITSERLCHQADFVSSQLLEKGTITSDWHNCLKLGYDVQKLEWPSWLLQALKDCDLSPSVLPNAVVAPGEVIGSVGPKYTQKWGLPDDVKVVGGTTDSNAAFVAAAGGSSVEVGTAVVSLGSTLAIKQVSSNYIEDASVGVYSHRFPGAKEDLWLVGGASNVGCAILRKECFSNDELVSLSERIDPMTESPLDYYPLCQKGERFPVADSEKEGVLDPKPEYRSEYLKAILQGISSVERDGFLTMCRLGASPPTQVVTCGGGSKNPVWTRMRERRLREVFDQVTVGIADNTEASFGAALLARSSWWD